MIRQKCFQERDVVSCIANLAQARLGCVAKSIVFVYPDARMGRYSRVPKATTKNLPQSMASDKQSCPNVSVFIRRGRHQANRRGRRYRSQQCLSSDYPPRPPDSDVVFSDALRRQQSCENVASVRRRIGPVRSREGSEDVLR